MLFHRPLRVAGLLLGLGLLAGSAQAQNSVTPAEGTIGTIVTITANKGTDFGTKTPKVWLGQDDSKKKLALKVTEFDGNTITAEIRKVDKKQPDTTFNVVVQPKIKKADPIQRDDAFTTRLIQVTEGQPIPVDSALGATLDANYMEGKPAKVKIDGKGAKVTDWDPDGNVGDAGGVGFFSIVPSKKLPNGTYDLELKTRSGTVVLEDAVQVTGSTAGKPKKKTFSARIGKSNLKAPKVLLNAPNFGAIIAPLWTQMLVTVPKGKTTSILNLTLDWKPEDGDAILDEDDIAFSKGVPFQITKISGPIFNPTLEVDIYNITDFDMTICVGGGNVFGTFSGTLTRNGEASNGNSPNTLEITKGQFNLPIIDGGGVGL